MSEQKAIGSTKRTGRRFKVGDRVQFRFGSMKMTGVVIEDRGKIGVGGRRLLRIRVLRGDEERVLELPVEEVRAA